MTGRLLKFLITALLFLAGNVNGARAEKSLDGEYLVKAAFLYNFAKFVEWPPDAFEDEHSPVVLGILGVDPFRDTIASISGKKVRGRILVVKHYSKVEDLERCHILFISSSKKDRLEHIFNLIRDSYMLTVGDMNQFALSGGIVNLVRKGNKVKFEINIKMAQKARLKISSKLLKLATIVDSRP